MKSLYDNKAYLVVGGYKDIDHLYITLNALAHRGIKLYINQMSYEILLKYTNIAQYRKDGILLTWSFASETADIYLANQIPLIYPMVNSSILNIDKFNSFFSSSYCKSRAIFSEFVQNFRYQNELYDLAAAKILEVDSIIYVDMATNLNLLKPENQIEFRRHGLGYMKFVEKGIIESYNNAIDDNKLAYHLYKLTNVFPWHKDFSKWFFENTEKHLNIFLI
jgi:hypothetical protein